MKQYRIDLWTGMLRFYNDRMNRGRARTPRVRAQKLFCRFGGMPFLPMRIAHYPTPAFYYSDLMRHRRKQDLDYGESKLRNGLYRALQPNTDGNATERSEGPR